jgi:hypothetical protein
VPGLTNLRIAGVALFLFSGILLAVGMHHLVVTGTCSSTGYSANYGPVPHCPSGTGWWMGFLFVGIFGGIAGGMMAGSLGLLFAGIFGGIGVGALTVAFDHAAHHGSKLFGGIFGACFAVVGLGALASVLLTAARSLQGGRSSPAASRPVVAAPSPVPATATAAAGAAIFGTPATAPADDPILGAYQASSNDSVNKLSELAELHRKGDLSDDEFAKAKSKLLGEV